MTKTIRFGAAGIALFAAMGMSNAASAQDSATATATAEVLDSLTLLNDADLDFGTMIVDGAGGTVSLAADGSLDCTSPDIVCSGTSAVAAFSVTGTASKAVTINLPASAVALQTTGWTATDPNPYQIELDSFVDSGTGNEITLDGAGVGSFTVGGSITFDGSEVAGVYSATFEVSVEYS